MRKGGIGNTGFRFSLKAEGTLVPVTTAAVSFLPTGLDWSIAEDETGIIMVHLPELKPDESYSYLLTAPGYEEMAGTLVATTGVMHRVDLILKKDMMSALPSVEDAKKIGDIAMKKVWFGFYVRISSEHVWRGHRPKRKRVGRKKTAHPFFIIRLLTGSIVLLPAQSLMPG